jgi:DnaJ-class molecular chaperone
MTYYEDLDISKSASQDDIKKAYKKMSLKYHPDKNPGEKQEECEKQFKKISHAYSVLSDDRKKRIYDMTGEDGDGNGNGKGDPSSFFDQMFKKNNRARRQTSEEYFTTSSFHHSYSSTNNGSFTTSSNNVTVFQDIKYTVNISLEDVFNGVDKIINLKMKTPCLSCCKECKQCQGKGILHSAMNIGPFKQMIPSVCNTCSGKGNIIAGIKTCEKCKGNGSYPETKTIPIKFDKGVQDGDKKTFDGMGEQPSILGGKPGNLIITISINPHPDFARKQNNIIYKHRVSFKESIIGKQFKIKLFNIKEIEVNTKDLGIIQPKKQYVIKGGGLPIKNHEGKFGDMYIEFDVDYPAITDETRKEFEELFEKLNM